MSLKPNFFRSIRVFISSSCGDKGRYDEMREKLAGLLDETMVFSAYTWEREGASSSCAGDNYIAELNDSDIAVVVVDNSDGVTMGVQKEIDQIRKTNKRALFYFVSEFSEVKTTLQEDLEGPDGATYSVVPKMSEIPERALRDLQLDVLKLYRKWCNHDVEPAVACASIVPIDGAMIPRPQLGPFPKLRGLFGSFLFGNSSQIDQGSELDNEITEFARALFVDFSVAKFDTSRLLPLISKMLPEPYPKLISKRFEAIQLASSGQYEDSERILEPVYTEACSLEAEAWFADDILIDLRNLRVQIDPFSFDNRHQEILDKNGREVVYPQLDRAISQALAEIEDDRIKEGTNSYNSITFGDNALRFFDGICSAFAIAVIFGSLTQVSRTLCNLKTVVFYLCQKYRDPNLNVALLKLSIACGGQGDASKTIQAFNNMSLDTDPSSAWDAFQFCANFRCLQDNQVAIFEAFGAFACYLAEADFTKASAIFITSAEELLESHSGFPNKVKAVFRAIERVGERLSPAWSIEYAVKVLSLEVSAWREEALTFFERNERLFDAVEANLLVNILDAFDLLLSSDHRDDMDERVCNVLVSMCEVENLKVRQRLDEVARKLSQASYERYRLILCSESDDQWLSEYVLKGVAAIEASNASQGVNGHYAFGLQWHIPSARRLASMHDVPDDLISRLYSACLGTLESHTYDLGGRINACHACCILLSKYGNRLVELRDRTLECLDSDDLFQTDFSFGRESKRLLAVWADTLGLLSGGDYRNRLLDDVLHCYQSDIYTQANAGVALIQLMENYQLVTDENLLSGFIFSYAGFLLSSQHFQLNLRGVELMKQFLAVPELRSPASRSLLLCFDGRAPRIKQMIIDAIDQISEFDSKTAERLKLRASCDNNYSIVKYFKSQNVG